MLVLLSDGRNQIVPNNDDMTQSDYTSYGYLAAGRMGSTNDYRVGRAHVDAKVAEHLRGGEGARASASTRSSSRWISTRRRTSSATAPRRTTNGKPLYYYVPDAGALETAFKEIGEDLTSLRVAR